MRCFWNYYSPWRGTAPEMYRVALCDLLDHGNELFLTLHLMEFESQLWLTRERLGLTEVPILTSCRASDNLCTW